jgi:hypothetical protein
LHHGPTIPGAVEGIAGFNVDGKLDFIVAAANLILLVVQSPETR